MVRLDVVQRVMEHETSTNILFLDACRDNPLARNLARALGTRSAEVGRGFAPLVSGVGTLISFSTQPGNVALDGTGRNSPFAAALAKHLLAPKEDLSAILIDVRNDVMRETLNKQVPWEHSALRGRFYFSPVAPIASAGPTAAPGRLSDAAEAWSVAERANTIAALEAFIRRFGDTYYGDLAKVRLGESKQADVVKKADDDARVKSEAERICANVAGISNVQVLSAIANQHTGTPASACIAARIEVLQKQQVALAAPPAAKPATAVSTVPAVGTFSSSRKPAPLTPSEERVLKPKDSFKECDECPEMVVVPAGSFMMGSPASEADRFDNEGPQRRITIGRSFAVGKFEVTFAEWDACVTARGCSYVPDDAAWGRGGRPVMNVSWSDITSGYLPSLARDRQGLPVAERGGVGICGTRINTRVVSEPALLVGRSRKPRCHWVALQF